ncbi:3,4-dihydroxy-2-butanone-4-phosphate synthase [Pseudonocardia sp. CA-107938]|uniref:3,4-dihydroxy-2-butanone-4-phosphate synthase n=1 Tax=Pseudonocardia sp. CA-107938 TaxID=3240021 RepID=UPI003D908EE5
MSSATQSRHVDGELARVERAVAAIAAGRPVVVRDDADGTGTVVFAAASATGRQLAFTVRHTSGLVCVALTPEVCDRLRLPPIHYANPSQRVTVDLAHGISTGISAHDRARTIAALGDQRTVATDFTRPGHVMPVQTDPDGLLAFPGPAEAAVELTLLAGLGPAAAFGAVISLDLPAEMAHGPELHRFATRHDLELVSVADLVAHRRLAGPPPL